jgi:outer membrane protein TolC
MLTVQAQTNAPSKARQMSLQDCIQMALQQNLDLRIDRYDPQVALYSLQGSYGAYDPTFSVSGQHDHTEAGAQIFSGGFTIPGSTSDVNSLGSTLNGLLPWGTTYTLGTLTPFKSTYGFVPTLLDNPRAAQANNTTNIPFQNTIGAVGFVVSQPLLKNLWIDQARLNIRVGKNRLKYSEQTLRLQIMQTITTLEQAYNILIYNRENVVVQEQALQAAQRLVAENRKKVEVGSLAPLDLESAEAQAASNDANLIAARSALAVQENAVKQLITGQYSGWADTVLEPAGTLTAPRQFLNRQDSWSKGLSQRPDIQQARLDIERVGIQLKFEKNQLYPELDVFGSYGYNGSGNYYNDALNDLSSTDRPFWTAGLRLSTPLSRTAARNNYRLDQAVMEQAVLRFKKMEQTVMINIDNDIRQAQSGFEQVAALRKAREFAESDLAAEQKKLESGKSTTYTVLLKQRDLTTARGNEIQALVNYNNTLSKLSFDEGSTLDRLGVNLEVK